MREENNFFSCYEFIVFCLTIHQEPVSNATVSTASGANLCGSYCIISYLIIILHDIIQYTDATYGQFFLGFSFHIWELSSMHAVFFVLPLTLMLILHQNNCFKHVHSLLLQKMLYLIIFPIFWMKELNCFTSISINKWIYWAKDN